MNPGPVNVTERVRKALLGPDLCHREEEFSTLMSGMRRKMLRLFGVAQTHTVALITGSGTAGLEAMLGSFAEKGKKVLVLSNGVYGERMRKVLELHGTPAHVLNATPGDFPAFDRIESFLTRDRSIHGVAMVHHETSTGMLNPLAGVTALAKRHQKTMLVDAVSSLGAEAIDMKDIGFLAGSAGKCLHAYPGVAFVFVSKAEAAKLRHKHPSSLYLDLHNTLSLEEKDDTPFTPAVQLFYALDAALDELAEEGLSRRIRTYAERSALLEQGFMELGLRFMVTRERRSHVLAALWLPQGVNYERLHSELKKAGFVIYAGQSKFAGRIFRVSNLGDMPEEDLRRFLKTLRQVLKRR
jgi:2-aminoethylphosphonate-pyruvate transaminase